MQVDLLHPGARQERWDCIHPFIYHGFCIKRRLPSSSKITLQHHFLPINCPTIISHLKLSQQILNQSPQVTHPFPNSNPGHYPPTWPPGELKLERVRRKSAEQQGTDLQQQAGRGSAPAVTHHEPPRPRPRET